MDTSAYVGFVERRSDALACSTSLWSRRFPRYVTSPIIAETHRRLLFKHGYQAAARFLTAVYGSDTTIVRPTEVDEDEAVRLVRKYSDLRLTLCDALTMAVMSRLRISRVFTYDHRHFLPVGLVPVPPLDI
jgi:predicted nucleic acid-binding protein